MQMIDDEVITILTVTNIAMTSISTPILATLARRTNATNSWTTGGRARSIQQHFTTAANSELRVLACVHGHDDVPSLLSLLNISHPTPHRPICLYLLQLLDLVGRGAPIFMPYKASSSKKKNPNSILDHMMKAIHNQLDNDTDGNTNILVQPFVSVSPHKTMHQDICSLAHDKFVSLLIMPFNYAHHDSTRLVAKNVLREAPCSVGLLVDSFSFCRVPTVCAPNGLIPYHIGIVFLGGADDREALCYVARMAERPCVRVTALRCNTPYDDRGDGQDADWERIEDENVVCEFRQKAATDGGVHYKEVVVNSVETMVTAIRSMGTNFDLMVVGRSHGGHSTITTALSAWNNSTVELGAVGDFLASPDFNQAGIPVLVMQQHKEVRSLRTIHGPLANEC